MRTIAAIASLGAGALHASAAGSHGEHRPAALAFALVALAQLGWGAAAVNAAALEGDGAGRIGRLCDHGHGVGR